MTSLTVQALSLDGMGSGKLPASMAWIAGALTLPEPFCGDGNLDAGEFCDPGTIAGIGPYGQDFEGLDKDDVGALGADGWLVFGNVFNADWSYAYGYGPFPAPNDGAAFSAIVSGSSSP